MKPTIRDPAGLVAGLLFLSFGAGAIAIARSYPTGSALHMGPGYFPTAIGALLVLVGLASLLRALAVTAPGAGPVALRPLLVITAAIALFAAAIDRIGLVPTTFLSALLAGCATRRPKIAESCLIAATLSVLAAGIFYYGLKLPFALF
jgi:hypothetical protein